MIIKYVYILVLASIFRMTVLSFEPCNTAQILQYAQLLGTKQDSCHYLVVHNTYYVNLSVTRGRCMACDRDRDIV